MADKRIQVAAGFFVAVFTFLVAFLTISISFGVGFERTLTWAIIVGLLGWIIAEQVVQRNNPRVTTLTQAIPQNSQPNESKSGVSWFSCLDCGNMDLLAPPDSVRILAKLEPCTQGDSKPMNWRCKRCGHTTVIHWDAYHPYVGTARIR